jgi:outer membrane protein
MKNTLTIGFVLATAIFALPGNAQTASLSLESAIKQAFTQGPDVANSKATLENARADLKAKESDPSTLVVQLTQARQTAELNGAQYAMKRLEIAQSVTNSYINLYEAQENLKILEAQLNLDTRSLEIAKTKLAAKNGTQLDVNKAENTLASSRQSLADAKANMPILSNRLEVLLGAQVNGNLNVGMPPAFKEQKLNLTALETGLEKRLPNVLQSSQNVALNQLNVSLYDNDYTAPSTLRDAKTNLENAKRNFETSRSNAVTSLRDSHRSLLNSLERVRIANQDFANAEDDLEQAQAKFKSGTISKNQLQQTEVSTMRSRFSRLQANDNYLKALFNVATASGNDVTGLTGGDAQ